MEVYIYVLPDNAKPPLDGGKGVSGSTFSLIAHSWPLGARYHA